jgi:hypothetical protein
MKNKLNISILIIVFTLLITNGYSQQILKIIKNYVLIDINASSGFKKGDKINVIRKMGYSDSQKIGTVQIVKFELGKCAAKIVSEYSKKNKIRVGDLIEMPETKDEFDIDYIFNDIDDSKSLQLSSKGKNVTNQTPKKKRPVPKKYPVSKVTIYKPDHTFSILMFGAGIIASGLGYYFYSQADQTYSEYQAAPTASDAVSLYNKTVDYDNLSQISLGIGSGLITASLLRIILKKPPKQPVSKTNLSINPVQKKGFVGIRFCCSLDKI